MVSDDDDDDDDDLYTITDIGQNASVFICPVRGCGEEEEDGSMKKMFPR